MQFDNNNMVSQEQYSSTVWLYNDNVLSIQRHVVLESTCETKYITAVNV